jgi:hypothetical protein
MHLTVVIMALVAEEEARMSTGDTLNSIARATLSRFENERRTKAALAAAKARG